MSEPIDHEEGILLSGMEPRLTERVCGGWLATSPRWSPIQIGVTAPTETKAREEFRLALERWLAGN